MSKENEILKLPLTFYPAFLAIESDDGKISLKLSGIDLAEMSDKDIETVANYIAESVNSRPALVKRIAELETENAAYFNLIEWLKDEARWNETPHDLSHDFVENLKERIKNLPAREVTAKGESE